MEFVLNRRDIGYTIISRFEETMRMFLADELETHFQDFTSGIPAGIVNDTVDRNSGDEYDDVSDLLENTNFPDLAEIVTYQGMYSTYFSLSKLSQDKFTEKMSLLYQLRNKIAHVREHFSSFDLDRLMELSRDLALEMKDHGENFRSFVHELEQNPNQFVISMPISFTDDVPSFNSIPNNVPIPDYEYEGGFVGRREDQKKILKLLSGSRNVITISGAGGVGKTALALRIVRSLMTDNNIPFDAIVWLSAKENRLSYLGIEDVEPTLKNYEELLDSIYEVIGFGEPRNDLVEKEADIETIFELYPNTLIVIDNLETITDDRITNFILDIEDEFPKVKILITSRRGLGQVERRHDLKQLKVKEAVNLFRRIARDKHLTQLARMDDETLKDYVDKLACYPLAIKWVIGQVAIGKNINEIISSINQTTSDISRFSFEQIYRALTPESKNILCALSVLDEPPSAGVLNYVVDLEKEAFEDGLQELILVSLVVPEQFKDEQNEISNRYTLLSLTRGYVRQQLDLDRGLKQSLLQRIERVQATIEEAERARKQYRFSLANLGASTEEERVAAMIAQNAFQKYQLGRYIEAVEDYRRAIQIAPRFASLYRNWAAMEAQEQHYVEANELMIKAADLNSQDVQIWLTWGNIRREEGKVQDALEKYQNAHKLSPDDNIVLNALGQAKARLGDYENADQLFRQALNVKDSQASVQNEIVNRSSIASNLVRWAESDRKSRNVKSAAQKLQDALEQCEIVLRLNSSDRRSQALHRKVLINLGFAYKKSKPIKAAKYFQDAMADIFSYKMGYKEAKDTIIAATQAGSILYELGYVDDAKKIFPKEIKRNIRIRHHDRRKSNFDALWQRMYEGNRKTGALTKFNTKKGYGFIEYDRGKSIFVHANHILGGAQVLEIGKRVSFKFGKDPKNREQAIDVYIIGRSLEK